MIKIENTVLPSPEQWKAAIMGARNPMNSWSKSDSSYNVDYIDDSAWPHETGHCDVVLGENDLGLLTRLAKAGTDHRKFMRMLPVICEVTAPMFLYSELDTYKVGTVRNSCSKMHKLMAKKFEPDDFSHDNLDGETRPLFPDGNIITDDGSKGTYNCGSFDFLCIICEVLNKYRDLFLETNDKKYWRMVIELLPSSYNQKSTMFFNYEVLRNIYHARKNHKLDEWHVFCDWIKTLPYAEELIADEE